MTKNYDIINITADFDHPNRKRLQEFCNEIAHALGQGYEKFGEDHMVVYISNNPEDLGRLREYHCITMVKSWTKTEE